ncbi:MAG: type II toxin-antitoxin system VapB family antitoxin [Burkholderiaceae bacterium]|jgi:antitoxin VapB|nr:type II toxin-antitoxin system VapB family antitoxin [Burkholderiaceae bacterium]
METAKLFSSGRSQAVRLPKAYRFEGTEVVVKRFGCGVLLLPVAAPWLTLFQALEEFEPGFEIEREQPAPQERAEWVAP